jgi:REP element-mobilizing transposase RayT
VTLIKSLTAREIFKQCPGVKKQLWDGEFWGKGCFVNTVGQHGHRGNGTAKMIAKYVQDQGLEKE